MVTRLVRDPAPLTETGPLNSCDRFVESRRVCFVRAAFELLLLALLALHDPNATVRRDMDSHEPVLELLVPDFDYEAVLARRGSLFAHVTSLHWRRHSRSRCAPRSSRRSAGSGAAGRYRFGCSA